MEDKEINLLLINKFAENNYTIKNIENNYFTLQGKNGIEFNVSYERCSCHGGRLTISSKHVEFWKRLESDFYDEEKGITNPTSELLYYINNEMFNIINSFETYIYKVVLTRGGYYKDKEEIKYFNNTKDISSYILGLKDKDIFTIQEQIITYPNKDIINKVKNVELKNGVLEFDFFRYERENEHSEFIKSESDYCNIHYRVSIIDKN